MLSLRINNVGPITNNNEPESLDPAQKLRKFQLFYSKSGILFSVENPPKHMFLNV